MLRFDRTKSVTRSALRSLAERASTAVCALTAATALGAQETPCKRPAPKPSVAGETIVLSETRTLPCKIQVISTGVELRTTGLDVADIASIMFRDPGGRYYTVARNAAEVSVWGPNGRFLQNFGREGRGPGEYLKGAKNIQFDSAGMVYVGDAQRRWAVLSKNYEYIRTLDATNTFVTNGSVVVLRDRRLLSTGQLSAGGATGFRVADISSATRANEPSAAMRTFGTPPEGTTSFGTPSARRIAYAGGETFWVSPPDGAGWGYVLEQWRTDGVRVRTMRREVSWFPKGAAGRGRGAVAARGADEGGFSFPPPEIEILHDDGTGLLYVSLMIPNSKFRALGPEIRDPARRQALQDEMVDIFVEVLDGNAGVVLASAGPLRPSAVGERFPTGLFAGTRQGYRVYSLPDGNRAASILEYKLVPN